MTMTINGILKEVYIIWWDKVSDKCTVKDINTGDQHDCTYTEYIQSASILDQANY